MFEKFNKLKPEYKLILGVSSLIILVVLAFVAGLLINKDDEGNPYPQGFGPNSTAQSRARDTVRKNDINLIYQKLEEFFNENGYYPTALSTDNLVGIDSDSLLDEQGRSIRIVNVQDSTIFIYPEDENYPDMSEYLYVGYNCDETMCETYEVSTWLERSSRYKKTSLN